MYPEIFVIYVSGNASSLRVTRETISETDRRQRVLTDQECQHIMYGTRWTLLQKKASLNGLVYISELSSYNQNKRTAIRRNGMSVQ